MRFPVKLGDETFYFQKTVRQRCQEILRSYGDGSVVRTDHAAFLLDLIAWHPDAPGKVGVGIDRFEVRRNEGYRTFGFYIVRSNGTVVDFSFNECIRPSSHRDKVLSAMRHGVMDQVLKVRDEAFAGGRPVTCPVTGVTLTRDTAHVDHFDIPFVDIAKSFVDESVGQLGWEAFAVVDGDGVIGARLASPRVLAAWQEYHRRNAQLAVISAHANISKGARRALS